MGNYVCSNCGKSINNPLGSMREPFCQLCFEELFKDDNGFNEYFEKMHKTIY